MPKRKRIVLSAKQKYELIYYMQERPSVSHSNASLVGDNFDNKEQKREIKIAEAVNSIET